MPIQSLVFVRGITLWMLVLFSTSLLRSCHSLSQPKLLVRIGGRTAPTRKRMFATSTEKRYEPFRKHPELFTDSFQVNWLHEDFVLISDAFQKATTTTTTTDDDDDDKSAKHVDTIIPDLLKKEMEGVYSFNVFNSTFIDLFNDEIAHFYDVSEKEKIPVQRPNSMNNYGVVVNEIGLRPLITSFQQEFLWPLSRMLFPVHASQFDDHHSFIVRYRANEDLGLDMHTDDADVTFNVCLGEPGFTGATLSFCGMFGAANHRQHTHTYEHQIGRAILHLGSRRHGADDIASGRRSNLIVWNHNWAYRQSGGYQNVNYEQEEGPPSRVCLSYTHDRDYRAFAELPASAQKQNLKPWCPPPGTEYEGFRPFKKKADNTPKSMDDL